VESGSSVARVEAGSIKRETKVSTGQTFIWKP
jgi:hypothetical protein